MKLSEELRAIPFKTKEYPEEACVQWADRCRVLNLAILAEHLESQLEEQKHKLEELKILARQLRTNAPDGIRIRFNTGVGNSTSVITSRLDDIANVMEGKKTCSNCGGNGTIDVGSPVEVECEHCKGTGREPVRGKESP